MKSRSTLILVVVTLVVGGLVVLDHYKGSTTEEQHDKGRRVVELNAEDVAQIELMQTNQTIVFEKAGDRWEIKQPITARADVGAISSILDGIEFADKDRTLTEKDLAGMNLADLGLVTPRVKVVLDSKKKGKTTLLLGGETPTKNAVYVQVEGRKPVYVINNSIVNRLERPLTDFRDRAVLDFSPTSTTRLELKSAERVVEAAKAAQAEGSEPSWGIVRPLVTRADQQKINEVLRDLVSLRVLDFISDDPKDVHRYRLGEPAREITISKSGTEGMLSLLLSAPLTNDASKVYGKLKNSDSIFTISAGAAQKLDVPVQELRDHQILMFTEADVHGIEVQRGADRLSLARSNENWQVTAPVVEEADNERVASLLANLRGLRVKQFAADVATDLERFGLAVPPVIVKLQGTSTNLLTQLLVGATDTSNNVCYVKRENEPFVYGVETNVIGWLPGSHLALRTRRVANISANQITKLEIQKPTGKLVIQRGPDAKWQLVEPPQGALNTDDVSVLIDVLAHLEAEEFLETKPATSSPPDCTIIVTLGEKTYSLVLTQNAATWIDPPLQFSVSEAARQTLTKDLVAAPEPTATNAPPAQPGS